MTRQDIEARYREMNNKTIEVKAYLSNLKDEERMLNDRLNKFELENNKIGDDLNQKDDSIDDL